MPDYTVLVLNEGPLRGKPSSFQEGSGTWGRKEVEPKFVKIEYRGSLAGVRHLLQNCTYDAAARQWKRRDSGEQYNEATDVINRESDFSNGPQRDRQLCLNIIPSPTGNDCDDLLPPFLRDESEMRDYWTERWYPLRRMAGMKKLLETAYYGTYADTREAMRSLTVRQRDNIFAELSDEEVRYLKAVCLADNPTEYEDYLQGTDVHR